jgi:predicted DNA-binding WGR domain protein
LCGECHTKKLKQAEVDKDKALPKLVLGDHLKARSGKQFINADGKEFYKEGDQGIVINLYTTDKGEECVKIVWDRTGNTSTMRMAVWMDCFEFMQHQALPKLALGDRLKARPGHTFINADGKELYKEGDQGTVAKFYLTDESEERMRIVWDRTGSTSTVLMAVWMQHYEFMHHQTRTTTVTFEPGPSDMRMTTQDGTVTEVNSGQAKEKVMPGGNMDCIDVISITV